MQVKLTGVANMGMTRATKRDDKNMPVLVWDETTVKVVFKDLSREAEDKIKALMGRPGMELTFELSSPQLEMTGLQSPDGVAMPMTPEIRDKLDSITLKTSSGREVTASPEDMKAALKVLRSQKAV